MGLIDKCLEPMETSLTMPKRNRYGIELGIFITNGFPKTITVENVIPNWELCPLIVEEVGEFDFWNEFDGFCLKAGKEPKRINWNSSWLGIAIGDRVLDESTMKLYKVTGFNKASGGSEIYFTVD